MMRQHLLIRETLRFLLAVTVALRRQRSHVRSVSGVPTKSETYGVLAETTFGWGKHRVSSRFDFNAIGAFHERLEMTIDGVNGFAVLARSYYPVLLKFT